MYSGKCFKTLKIRVPGQRSLFKKKKKKKAPTLIILVEFVLLICQSRKSENTTDSLSVILQSKQALWTVLSVCCSHRLPECAVLLSTAYHCNSWVRSKRLCASTLYSLFRFLCEKIKKHERRSPNFLGDRNSATLVLNCFQLKDARLSFCVYKSFRMYPKKKRVQNFGWVAECTVHYETIHMCFGFRQNYSWFISNTLQSITATQQPPCGGIGLFIFWCSALFFYFFFRVN